MSSDIKKASEPVSQLCVSLQNRVGTLSALVRMIKDIHVDVLGVSVQDNSDITLVRMIVTDPEAAGTLFMERGIPYANSEMLMVELDEVGNDFNRALAALLQAETNIQFAYPLMCRPNDKAVIAVSVDDYETGHACLSGCGFALLSQDELSR